MKLSLRYSLIIVVLIMSGLMLIWNLGLFSPIRYSIEKFNNSLSGAVGKRVSDISQDWEIIGSLGEISQENKELEEQVGQLRQQLIDIEEAARENRDLRSQLDVQAKTSWQLQSANLVSGSATNLRKTLTIDIGSSQGIVKGMAVVYRSSLIGLVEEVGQTSAQVVLLTDPAFRLAGLTQDSREIGLLQGQPGQGVQLRQLALDGEVKAGERVITRGNQLVPKGINVGTINSVIDDDGGLFQSALLDLDFDVTNLETVFVITGQ
ncbi:rod shape-determining protein MreC [Candidatus Saccharibacteria bacterium]|nr:rod shape-determining protein MreC [Candidatus Saccharibacteria bacterium]MCB9834823.1 rod shape-determining protein MreC [Candidatus Nomurabacteria bacterium]